MTEMVIQTSGCRRRRHRPGSGLGRSGRPRSRGRLADAADIRDLCRVWPERGLRLRGIAGFDEPRAYELPPLRLDQWGLSGTWTVARHAGLSQERGGRVAYRFHARDRRPGDGPRTARCPGRVSCAPGWRAAGCGSRGHVKADGSGVLRDQRTYQLIRQSGPIVERLFEMSSSRPVPKCIALRSARRFERPRRSRSDMTTDRVAALEALLAETETAHGAYETTQLNGTTTRTGRAGTRRTPSTMASAPCGPRGQRRRPGRVPDVTCPSFSRPIRR